MTGEEAEKNPAGLGRDDPNGWALDLLSNFHQHFHQHHHSSSLTITMSKQGLSQWVGIRFFHKYHTTSPSDKRHAPIPTGKQPLHKYRTTTTTSVKDTPHSQRGTSTSISYNSNISNIPTVEQEHQRHSTSPSAINYWRDNPNGWILNVQTDINYQQDQHQHQLTTPLSPSNVTMS